MSRYHVALSFAGEDREYVEKVAMQLRADGVDVFYDKFEEADLWGKNLYDHLYNVYQNKAHFTVIFVSEAYKKKIWTNHERQASQARAITESSEYILPAFFDESIEVPGLLKTTGRVSLINRTPEQLAALIIKKLQKSGVVLKHPFSYSEQARADADFQMIPGHPVSDLIGEMRSYTWPKQNKAIENLFKLDWTKLSTDEVFVLGRNLYQCACGNERRALSILTNLRRELAKVPDEQALDFLNGLFFEVYFNSNGEFRGQKLKGRCLDKLLALQAISKFSPSISFIRRALEPYRQELLFLPNPNPEIIILKLIVGRTDPPTVRSLQLGEASILTKSLDKDEPLFSSSRFSFWRLSFRSFTVQELKQEISNEWFIPASQLNVEHSAWLDEQRTGVCLPEGWMITCPRLA